MVDTFLLHLLFSYSFMKYHIHVHETFSCGCTTGVHYTKEKRYLCVVWLPFPEQHKTTPTDSWLSEWSWLVEILDVCSVYLVDLGVFDLSPCPSLLPVFETELEFFVFSPGGVASTGLIQNTQTNCSTTPAATVSKPPLLSAYCCVLLQHHAHLSPWLPPHTTIHGYQSALRCLAHLSPWLPPCMLVSLAMAQHRSA